jgi:predicted dehydrogenase
MTRLNRRRFLQGTVAAGAAFTIAGTKSSGKVLGANDAIRVAVAGLNGRGGSHVKGFAEIGGVQVTALVDPDKRTWPSKVRTVQDLAGNTPKTYQDIRQALDEGGIDAVTVATPNHWHSLITLWACEADKDVYVEKPMCHNVHEGRVAVQMARKHNRIVQHGTQSRSSERWAQVVEIIKSGQLGKLKVARALCYKRRESIGFKSNAAPPADLDFNLWLGPAPEQPYHGNLVHYNWHWFWDMGNGDIGNQGVHQMDIARWGIPGATFPKSVASLGGRFGYSDQGQTANTQISVMDFGGPQLIFEVRGLIADSDTYLGEKVGNIFHLEGGVITDSAFYPAETPDKEAPLPQVNASRGPGGEHFANFIEAVRTRKTTDLNADVEDGYYSSALCHLANISYRLGEIVSYKPGKELFKSNDAANESVSRMAAHLKAHDVSVDGLELRMGRTLAFDATSERFSSDSQANALLSRDYRRGFELPKV